MANLTPKKFSTEERVANAAKKTANLAENPNYYDPIEKAKRNPKSLRMAINGKCWDCCGAGVDPETRKTIGECTVYHCPLWTLRPYQKKNEGEEDNESA